MNTAPDVDKLVSVYIKIRDKKAELSKEYDAADKELTAKLDKIKTALLDHCKATNQDGGKTSHGTFTRSVKTRYWTSDWEAMRNFVMDNDALELLEKRISQRTMKQFLEENPDLVPPALNTDSEYTITVRRPTK
jgi:phage host-nuclease inhibitor protein Gam